MTTPLNFAPYSEPPPSPPSRSRYLPTASTSTSSYQSGAPISSLGSNSFSSHPTPSSLESNASSGGGGGGAHWNTLDGSGMETSLGRHDQEAAACYALGPFGAALLLIYERENDYVRFHAFQSAMMAAAFFLLHLFFLLISTHLAWPLFMIYVCASAFMSWKAYRDSDLLDRFHIPYIGPIAQHWVEEE